MTGEDVTLDDLRKRLNSIDRQLLTLVAERKAVSHEVARVKRTAGRPTRDYEREREVIVGVRAIAKELDISPGLAEDLLRTRLFVPRSTTQEKASVVGGRRGVGPPGAGHRRRRRDGPVVRGLSRFAGVCHRGRRSRGRARRRHRGRRLAQFRSQARLHRARHTDSAHGRHTARPGSAPPAWSDFRHRVPESRRCARGSLPSSPTAAG